jgi:competence ComEA-like helix-hairpin-helix protein
MFANRCFLFLTAILFFICGAKSGCSKAVENERFSGVLTVPKDKNALNINTAGAAELEQLPGIGRALSERIISHRETYGPFRRPEHLLIVRGMSEGKYRAIEHLIRTSAR